MASYNEAVSIARAEGDSDVSLVRVGHAPDAMFVATWRVLRFRRLLKQTSTISTQRPPPHPF